MRYLIKFKSFPQEISQDVENKANNYEMQVKGCNQ